jgi:glutamate racemase
VTGEARAPLLVLDWGIGGFGVVRALWERDPGLPVLYVSDAGFRPYGKVPAGALAARLETLLAHFAALGAQRAVLACNAASTVAHLVRAGTLEVLDMLDAGVDEVRRTGLPRVGLLGGARTVLSGNHRRRLAALGVAVRGRVAQPLSARIERGDLASAGLEADVARIVGPLRRERAVLLACTHYPAIEGVLQRHLPGVRLLDPARAVAERVCPVAAAARAASPRVRAFTTGSPEATRAGARAAFGIDPGRVTPLAAFASRS